MALSEEQKRERIARRIALEPLAVWATATTFWGKIRRQDMPQTTVFLERLQSRKAQVGEGLEKVKAARRFEPGEIAPAAPEGIIASARPTESPKKTPPNVKKPAEKEEDFATRLMRAKKKAMEDRDKT